MILKKYIEKHPVVEGVQFVNNSEFNEIKQFLTERIESIIDVEFKKCDSAENDYIVVLKNDGDNQTEKLVINKGDYIVLAPEGYKLNPLYVETKTKRLQLVLQPSLFDRVKKGAKQAGLSVNEYVHRILDEATKGEE